MAVDEARLKGCAWPTATAIDYAANRAYKVGDLIKVGPYVTTGRWGGGYHMWLTMFMKHGYVPTKTDGTVILTINYSVASPQLITFTGTQLNLRTGGNPPSSPATFVSDLAAISDATAGFNLSKTGMIFTQEWADGGSFPGSSSFGGESFSTTDAYYTCSREIAASSYAPDGYYGVDDALPTGGEPWHRSHWYPMPSDYAPSTSQGVARSDCTAENAYEAKFCGRCGRPI